MIMDTTQEIATGVSKIKGLKVLGCDPNPHAMIVCFSAADGYNLDIYQVAEAMSKENWSLNSLQNPASIHLCVTLKTVEYKSKFISDLKKCVDDLLRNPKEKKEGSSAAIYGATGSMPAGPVNELLKVYTDVTLSC
jgi:sphinganine-1-phosphate aldolase